ncbi:MAG: adenylate synthase [Verrucomicrobiaceae bacterium]|nr:MAG: adenylate synthase [Verrucomicrobiaceae bacterium]
MDAFLIRLVKEVPFYQGQSPRLESLPVMDKAAVRENFAALNRHAILLEEAEAVALQAETRRDFTPVLPGGVTVGLSSGTSGKRGVFLVSPQERAQWAGMILAKMLSRRSLIRILTFWRPPLRIAFFLRADSNLYRTVASRRIDFRFYDLLRPLADLAHDLETQRPHILIAPASVLAELAAADHLEIHPEQIISVAEVLDERDAGIIRTRFRVEAAQVYQATEGFLACTCREGRLHLNEEVLHIEPQWLDAERTRFHPLITDFSRVAQAFVRHRLDDVLVMDERECPCGNPALRLARIEGRADEILRFPEPVFPEVVRQALYTMPDAPDCYRIEQHGAELRIFLRSPSSALAVAVGEAMTHLFARLGLRTPRLVFPEWTDQPRGEKRLRIRCVTPLHPHS